MELKQIEDFDGVFRISNPTDEDFIALWNNIEYVIPAQSRVPMIINGESLEGIQEIRKKWAYKIAVREFYRQKGGLYSQLVKQGRDNPSTFNEKVLEPIIDMCLNPLPIVKPLVTNKKVNIDGKFKASKAVNTNSDLNKEFKDSTLE